MSIIASIDDQEQPPDSLSARIDSDRDGTRWTGFSDQTGAITAELASLSSGAHQLDLVVTDDQEESSTCSVQVTVN